MRECVNALREGRHECCNHHVYIVKELPDWEDRAKQVLHQSFTPSFNAV
jgi:hypothetical protein